MATQMEIEFREMTGAAHKSGEPRQSYLERVYKKVRDLSDDDWEKLTAKAQRWFNDAGRAGEEDDLPDFPDVEPDQSEIDVGTEEKESEDTDMATAKKKKAATTAKKKVAAKPAAKKKVAAKSNGTGKRVKGALRESGTAVMKRALFRNPNLDDKALMKLVKEAGFKLSPFSIAARKQDFLHTIKVLEADGKLKT